VIVTIKVQIHQDTNKQHGRPKWIQSVHLYINYPLTYLEYFN